MPDRAPAKAKPAEPSLTIEVVTDPDAPAGNVLPELARLLLARATRRLAQDTDRDSPDETVT
jgi:hypothetical protein